MNFENQDKINFFDLLGAIAAGLLNGFLSEKIAHSWKISQPDFLAPMLVAASSYLLVFLILKWQPVTRKFPVWITLAIIGSATCFLSLNLIKFVNGISRTMQTDLDFYSLLTGYIIGFFLHTLIYSFIALLIIGTSHFVDRFITQCRTNQWT